MWNCVNCGERNSGPDGCTACGRPRRSPLPWEAPPRAPASPPHASRHSSPHGSRHASPHGSRHASPHASPHDEDPVHSRLLPAVPIVVLAGSLITAAVFGGPRLLGEDRDRPAGTRPAAVVPIAPEQIPILEDTGDRLVTIGPAVTDPRAAKVAAVFETFFTGINDRDYPAVASVLDPAGELDPGEPDQMAAFARGTSTTHDSDVLLRDLDPAGNGRLRAVVTFRSSQRAGHGPPGRLDETCTRWRVVYRLTPDGGRFRIRQADATTRPC